MTYVFHPLQHRQVAESFCVGAEEEHCPPIEAAVVDWCRAHFGRVRHQCDCVASQLGIAHGGACALGGMGRHGRLRGAFGGHGVAGVGRNTPPNDKMDGTAGHDPIDVGGGGSGCDRWVTAKRNYSGA